MIADWINGPGLSVVLVLATLGALRVLRDLRKIGRYTPRVIGRSAALVSRDLGREVSR